MMQIINELLPDHYKTSSKLALYYLKCLKDKKHIVRLPDVSPYEIEVHKLNKGLTVVNHGYYITQVANLSFPILKSMLEKEYPNPVENENDFILDLRF